jgi:hypothetical protein
MTRATFLLFIFGISALLSVGCMMPIHKMFMSHNTADQKHLIKEFLNNEVSITLDIPPLVQGKESMLIVKAVHVQDGTPIEGATVLFAIQSASQVAGDPVVYSIHPSSEFQAEEITGTGIYQLRYTFESQGTYEIAGKIWLDKTDLTAPPLTVVTTQGTIHHEGAKKSFVLTILGGIGMVAMMAVMML